MTTPETPGPAGTNGRPPADGGVDQPPAITDEVPAVTDEQPVVTDAATAAPDLGPVNAEQQTGTADEAAAALSSPVPPRQHAGHPGPDAETTAVGLQVAQPEHSRSANQPKADPRPPGPAYGHSPNFVPASQASPRYGRPVAQPFNTQSSRGSSPNFSQPTVRIGGRVQPEQAAAQPSSSRVRPTRIPRRASLQLRYLEPWSVLKVSLVLSVAGFLAWMVAVGVLYSILGGMGVWDQLNGTYSDLTSVNDPEASEDLISAGGVFGVAALVGMVNIVLITAMCTVGAFIYNASADLAGGIEVTLSERD